MLVTADTHPDAICTFNGDDISSICSAANVEEGWAEVLISIPRTRDEIKAGRLAVACVGTSGEKDSAPMIIKIYGKVEIDLKGNAP